MAPELFGTRQPPALALICRVRAILMPLVLRASLFTGHPWLYTIGIHPGCCFVARNRIYYWYRARKGWKQIMPRKVRSSRMGDGPSDPIYQTTMGMVWLKGCRCGRCGHEWLPRDEGAPKACARCKSPYWDKPRKLTPPDPMYQAEQERQHGEEMGRRHHSHFQKMLKRNSGRLLRAKPSDTAGGPAS